ncbi:MAG: SDR family NAD(P)-dependent oxidoreductase, partial [Planctomycetota bacterium]|nr:SDR family NAD(P)-dependent oxidoreductase [Planctomycetota bacterium]
MTLSTSLQGRHALVCGASSGIGREIALCMAAAGAKLSLLARSADKLNTLTEDCHQAGAESADAYVVDLEDRLALAETADA